jgi:hypothetical protein
MFWLWLIGVVVFGMYAGYRFGLAEAYIQNDIGFILVCSVLFWPFVLGLAIVLSPFIGMVYLGARAKKKKEN